MRGTRTDVLIVGAGPIGLWTAILLAEAGVQVTIIDREFRPTARTYACALHPRTMGLLQTRGLADPILEQARRIAKVAFYEGAQRRAEIDVGKLSGAYPFLSILPQSALESLLEQRLRQAGVKVLWQHQLVELKDESDLVTATIEHLQGTSTGYIVPHWETVVAGRFELRAQYVLGADGQGSKVRQCLGIGFRTAGPSLPFAAYEFESDRPAEDEIRVAMGDSGTSVLWPLTGNRCRWTFQLAPDQALPEFPLKDRRAVRLAEPDADHRTCEFIARTAQERAPWFKQLVQEIHWSSRVTFQQRVVNEFGRGNCWLAGDAAHQTGPVGVQSMNLGFAEAVRLSQLIPPALQVAAPVDPLKPYDQELQAQWQQLLGLTGGLKPRGKAEPWVVAHAAAILPCIPATDGDFNSLANQLGLGWSS
jgi:2-polyprenyl-6-methoxyphenol hydroxylase-like FAD-dependent oxidoreductase